MKPKLLAAAATAAVLAVVLVTWLTWPSAAGIPGADRVRQYVNLRACMLTGARGVTGSLAAAAWAGMEEASGSSKAMVSYLSVPDPATKATALPYLASLAQRQCNVIIAVGQAQVAAAAADAVRFRQIHFVVITAAPSSPGVTRISPAPSAQVHAAVQAAVSAALHVG